VAYYFHDSSGGGAGKALRVVSVKFPDLMKDGRDYKSLAGFTGKGVRAAEVDGVAFPTLLEPLDDLPPATMITSVRREGDKLIVRGVSHDNGKVKSVEVNGFPATIDSNAGGVANWGVTLNMSAPAALTARAVDEAGNSEKRPATLSAER